MTSTNRPTPKPTSPAHSGAHDRFYGTAHGLMSHPVLIIALVVFAYLLFHGHHYRRNRRRGHGVWISLRGPFNTRVSKEF